MEFLLEALNEKKPLKDLLGDNGGIDLNNAGKTSEEIPLHLAAMKCNKEAIEELLAAGADINVKNNENQTALTILASPCEDLDDFLSTMKLLMEKGIEVPDCALTTFSDNPKQMWILIRNDKDMKLKVEADIHSFLYQITSDEIDIVSYYLNHPEFNFSIQNRSFTPGFYTAIDKYIELQQWENAMQVAVLAYQVDYRFDRHGLNEDDENKHVMSKIFENMTDFSYVDCNGTKLVDMIFQSYLEEIDRLKLDMGKKLLELGADKKVLMQKFVEALGKGLYSLEKLIETGIDLDGTHIYEDKDSGEMITIVLKESLYLESAEFGMPKLLKQVIQKGADIFVNFDSSTLSSIELCIKAFNEYSEYDKYSKYDECLEIILKEIMKRVILADVKIQSGQDEIMKRVIQSRQDVIDLENERQKYLKKEKLLTVYLKENGKGNILSKIGFLPKSPQNLSVTHSGLSCNLKWDIAEQTGYPITGYKIQVLRLAEIEGQKNKLKKVLKENAVLCHVWEYIEKEIDETFNIVFQSGWKTMKNILENGELGLREITKQTPELGTQIDQVLQANSDGVWKTVCELAGANQTHQNISPLSFGSEIKFCVFAQNENGFSDPPVESDFQKVTVKPDQPGQPDTKIVDEELVITWIESESARATGVTMYRVEGLTDAGQWKVLGKVSADYYRKLQLPNYAELGISSVRVIAQNEDGESEPSESNIKL